MVSSRLDRVLDAKIEPSPSFTELIAVKASLRLIIDPYMCFVLKRRSNVAFGQL